MVFGFSIAVICVPVVNQWADITKTALGFGISFPNFAQVLENSLSSIPFIGEPCPMNNTGSLISSSFKSLVQLYKGCSDAIAAPPISVFMNVFRFNLLTFVYTNIHQFVKQKIPNKKILTLKNRKIAD